MGSWVRKDESWVVPDPLPERDQVEIQGAWFVKYRLRRSTETTFQGLKLVEQRLRRGPGERTPKAYGIEEIRGSCRAIHRNGSPQGGEFEGAGRQTFEFGNRASQGDGGIPQIGT